jgi:hypothetical protein
VSANGAVGQAHAGERDRVTLVLVADVAVEYEHPAASGTPAPRALVRVDAGQLLNCICDESVSTQWTFSLRWRFSGIRAVS